MALGDEEKEQLWENVKKDSRQLYEKVVKYPLISLLFIIAVLLLIALPHWQVSGIDNSTVQATQENQDRATLAQILGGVAIGIGLYYTWRRIGIAEKELKATQDNLEVTQQNLTVAQENLKVSQEGQITERFTRAVNQLGAIDQLGNPAIEIRLGGIYALERIANESQKDGSPTKDYWPIMEILTAYIRKNSSFKAVGKKIFTSISMDVQANETTINEISDVDKLSLDIQAILTVIKRRKFFFGSGESIGLDLQKTHLRKANLVETHLIRADLSGADLSNADLPGANLSGANLSGANLLGANLLGAKLVNANLSGANLSGAINLTIEQLSKVNTLYKTQLNEELLTPLKEKFPALFEKPE
jgi:hypothetical protein